VIPRTANADIQLSVVLPCHNEADALPVILPRIREALAALHARGITSEVILVDDGSTDGSVEVARALGFAPAVVNAQCRGYGAALKAGFASARGARVTFFDLDNTYWPEDLEKLTGALEDGDIVMGTRPFFESGMPVVRVLGNLLFVGVSRYLLGGKISDLSTGFRMFRRDLIPEIIDLPSEGLNFSMHLTLLGMAKGWHVREIPIRYSERIGDSKLSVFDDGIKFLWLMLKYRIQSSTRMLAAPLKAVAVSVRAKR